MRDADKTPLWTPPIEATPQRADETPLPISGPRPTRRRNATHSLRIGGHKIFVTVDFDAPSGRVCRFYVDLHKEGAPLRGAAAIVAEGNNRALDGGGSLESVCEALRHAGFEPSGMVEGHPTIKWATSIFDLVAQVIEDEDPVLRAEVAERKKAVEARAKDVLLVAQTLASAAPSPAKEGVSP
jgi:hypothetical protein